MPGSLMPDVKITNLSVADLVSPRLTSISLGMPFDDKREKDDGKKDMDEPSETYKEMSAHWDLILDLRGGTLEMRRQAQKWLPREPRESIMAYNNRLGRSVCYGAYNRTVSTLAGLPFLRAVTVENIPPELSYLVEDADSTGRDLSNYGHSILKEMLELGLTHILVDMPYFEGELTLEQEQQFKIRPYFSHISPTSIIRWTTQRIGGLDILTSIWIKEEFTEYHGLEEKEIEQVRIITPTEIRLYRENEEDEEWYLYNTFPNNLGKIPLVTIYGNRTGFLTAKPPLEDLAWLNLKHYQKLSDLDNIEHVANVPLLFGKGFDEGELEGIEIGPNRMITSSNKDADIKYVEHTGAAIAASQKSIKDLEDRMAAMGADLIIRKSVDRQTATARKIDQSESVSLLQIMINNLEAGLESAIKLAGEWKNISVSDELQVDAGDYLDTPDGPNLIDLMAQILIENQGMTIEDVQYELKRRGVLSDTFKLGKRSDGIQVAQPAGNQPAGN